MADGKFDELEARILQTIELLKTTRRDKDLLEKELASERRLAAGLEKDLTEFRRERAVIQGKVETLLETLSELSEESLV